MTFSDIQSHSYSLAIDKFIKYILKSINLCFFKDGSFSKDNSKIKCERDANPMESFLQFTIPVKKIQIK